MRKKGEVGGCIGLMMALVMAMGLVAGNAGCEPGLELMATASTTFNDERSIAIEGDYAYVGSNRGYITVFDITDPYNPVQVGSIGPSGQQVWGLDVCGDRLYAANDAVGFAIYDISDPSALTELGRRSDGRYAWSVYIDEGTYPYAYVSYGYTGSAGLAIYDVSDPSAIGLVAQYNATGGSGRDIWVQDGLAYLLNGHPPNALDIIDISDPSSPGKVGWWDAGKPYPWEVIARGDYAYLSLGEEYRLKVPGGLRIVDVSDPTSPFLVGSYPILGCGEYTGQGLAVDGDYAYVVSSIDACVWNLGLVTPGTEIGLWQFDISHPTDPILVDFLDLGAATVPWGGPNRLAIKGSYAFLAMSAGGSCAGGSSAYDGLYVVKINGANSAPVADAGEDLTVEQESYHGTEVTLDGSGSTDPDSTPGTNDDIVSFDWYEGDTFLGSGETMNYIFPLGPHPVTLVVSDSFGETGDDEVMIVVEDTTPPSICSVSASPNTLWPPNHKMVDVTVTAAAEDICDAAPVCRIVDVTSNEPIDGLGDGHTEPDWEITGAATVKLRAERAGVGTGRVYTIHVECTDASGNTATATVDVTVPHDKGEGKK